MSVYDDVKKAIQALLAPDIQEIKGELKAVNTRIDGIEKRFDYLEQAINTRFDALDRRFDQTNEKIDNLVRQLNLEQRIAKIEEEQKKKPN